jgi:hypothetical protein
MNLSKKIFHIAILALVFLPNVSFAGYTYQATGGFTVNIISEREILITDPTGNNSGFSIEHGFYSPDYPEYEYVWTGSTNCNVNEVCVIQNEGDWNSNYFDRGQRYAIVWANNPEFPDCAFPYYDSCSNYIFPLLQNLNGEVDFNVFASQTSGLVAGVALSASDVLSDNLPLALSITVGLFLVLFLVRKIKKQTM